MQDRGQLVKRRGSMNLREMEELTNLRWLPSSFDDNESRFE